jgi:hypothetical protein
MADEKTLIITQKDGERFALDHEGSLALYGKEDEAAMQHDHRFGGQVAHTTPAPLVHVIGWEEHSCTVEHAGRVTVAGDSESPVEVRMSHHFANEHKQSLRVEPFDHALQVRSALAEPIHHALQMRTPVQLRFCNPWHVASDYVFAFRLGQRTLFSIRLAGATVARPQACEDENPCPPVRAVPDHP